MNHGPLTPAQRAELEKTYRQLCSSIVALAALLGKPSLLKTHEERRQERLSS